MKMRLLLKFLCITPLVLASCQNSKPTPSSILIVGLSDPPTTLDPRYATDANSKRLCDLIFSSLVKFENDLKIHPSLATSWIETPHKLIFKIQKSKYQDGKEVTLADIKRSFDEYRKPTSLLSYVLKSVHEVKIHEPDQLIFDLDSTDASLLSNLTDLKILPSQAFTDPNFSRNPTGSGPLKFLHWTNNEIVLSSPDDSKQIKFQFIRDETTRYLKMVKGEIDILLNELQEDKVEEIKKLKLAQVLVTQGLNFNYLILNLNDPRLKDIRLRQALFAGIDRGSILEYTLHNLGELASSILAPVNPMALKLEVPALSLSEAKNYIKESKLLNRNFILKTSDQAQGNGTIIADQLQKNLGLKITSQCYEWATYYSDIKAGRFQLALMRWVGIIDPDVYRDTLSTKEFAPAGRNRGFYSNPDFDRIVEQAKHELNFDKRKALYTKAQFIIVHDLPILPLWYNANISVLGFRIKNFKPAVTGSFIPLLDVVKE